MRTHKSPSYILRRLVVLTAVIFLAQTACGQGLVAQTNVNTFRSGGIQSETSIAINPQDPNNLIVGANIETWDPSPTTTPSPAIATMFSTDGGATWGFAGQSKTTSTGNTFTNGSDPWIAFDKDGNAYYAYILANIDSDRRVTTNALVVSKSTDKGATWGAPVPVVENLSSSIIPAEDKEAIAVDQNNGNIYVTWTHFYKGPIDPLKNLGVGIYFSRSTDGGASFSIPISVTPRLPLNVQYSMPAVAPNGDVYVVWTDWTFHTINVSKSTDGGITFMLLPFSVGQFAFQSPRYSIPAQPSRGIGPIPSIACDKDGNIYVAWSDLVGGAGSSDTDIFIRRSDDGGRTWDALGTSRKRVNNDSGGASQFHPALSVDPIDNSINITYYDTRDDGSNAKAHYYLSRSTDGGRSFTDMRVTNVQSTGPNSGGPNDYGDYSSVVARGGIVFPAWTDRRMAQKSIFVARVAVCSDLAVIPVTTAADDAPVTPGGLRSALLAATGCDRIVFRIPKMDSSFASLTGAFIIRPYAPMPPISASHVEIDGLSENAFLGENPNPLGGPSIELSNSNSIGSLIGASGLTINSDVSDTSIRGLSIVGFGPGSGINVNGRFTRISNCWIGVRHDGTGAFGNETGLVLNQGADHCLIDQNVISGNWHDGLNIGSTDNLIFLNLIGTHPTGAFAVGNGWSGIFITGARNRVGFNDDQLDLPNAISGNGTDGIQIAGVDNVVGPNFIGTDSTGTMAVANGWSGVKLFEGASGNVVGIVGQDRRGPTKQMGGGRNVISGNVTEGVLIRGVKTHDNQVNGNLIGLEATGHGPLPNRNNGVRIEDGTSGNIIGGGAPELSNVISYNGENGVNIAGLGTTGNILRHNFIGTEMGGMEAAPNARNGVFISFGASGNKVGEGDESASNVIAFNRLDGVRIETGGVGNSVLRNSIHDNGRLGINLGGGTEDVNGVTGNDDGDGDEGANGLQNFPTLEVGRRAGQMIEGTLNAKPQSTYTLEFFSNDRADPSGFGEGQSFLTRLDGIRTDSQGNARFSFIILGGGTVQRVTATATDEQGNTSEFSHIAHGTIYHRAASIWERFGRFFRRLFGLFPTG